MHTKVNELQIAIFYTLFNLFKIALLSHQTKLLAKLSRMIIPDKPEDMENETVKGQVPELDEIFLDKPAFAMEQCKNVACKMADAAKDALASAISLISSFDMDVYNEVITKEEMVDNYEDKLGTYMLKLNSHELNEADSKELSLLLHIIGDFERISDHAVNIAKATKKMNKKELAFSKKAESEVAVFCDLILDIINTSIDCFVRGDEDLATYIEPMEEVADKLNKEIKKRHVKRLRKGKCSIDMGFVLSDITTDFERIADHCSNIAVGVIQTHDNVYDSHEYLDTLDKSENTAFYEKYVSFKEKYVLP
jgi:phosphate:Na+ symporter